jgi:CheY-like chemotaxis protein
MSDMLFKRHRRIVQFILLFEGAFMDMSPGKKPAILVIEADASLRRLIALGLQNRDMHVIEASSAATVPTVDLQQLDLLVIDIDASVRHRQSLPEAIQQHPQLSLLPTIVLSWDDVALEAATSSSVVTAAATQVLSLPKPFDARKLHRAIERLLQVRAESLAQEEARAEALLLASYTSHTAPSPWPVVTAAGLLLAMIGMLLQVAVAVIGFLIVIIALLLWTLGSKRPMEASEPRSAHAGA